MTKVHNEARRFAAGGLRHPADRPRGPRGGRRDDRGGARRHPARRRPRRRVAGPGPRPGQGRLAVPDHAVRRRDHADRRRTPRPVPHPAVAAERRHLLRDAEPASGGEGDRARGRAVPRRGVGELVNSVRMVEVARAAGATAARLVENAERHRRAWLDGVQTVGLSSGASVPEVLVQEVAAWLADHGYDRHAGGQSHRGAADVRLAAGAAPRSAGRSELTEARGSPG